MKRKIKSTSSSFDRRIIHYQEFLPATQLRQLIECYWVLQSNTGAGVKTPQKILPDGCIELLFHFGDPVLRHEPGQQPFIPSNSFISGQKKTYLLLEPTGRVGTFGIRFRPWGAAAFFLLPISELNDRIVPLKDIWPNKGQEIEDIVVNSRSISKQLGKIDAFLLKRLNNPHLVDPIVVAATKLILTSEGRIRVDKLSSLSGVSSRQLERRFSNVVGLTPKTLCRLFRYQRIFDLIEKKAALNLTELSYEAGYYDQAHFIREFKTFSGLNPTAYFSQENLFSDFFTSKRRMSNLYNYPS